MAAKDDIARARELLGQVLRDRWLLEQVLGVGGMAAVFAARHRNGARAAIKLMHGPVRDDPVIKERFLREAYIANTVGHPGVPHVLDDDEDPQLGPYLIMELLEGESLDEIFKRKESLPVEKVLDIADQALDVLAAAHERGIVHRDLKPGNIFLCRDGSVRVLDFGIARLMHDQSARLTATGMMMGTPAYMAPEQARTSGRMVDGRSDLYSLGATMFRVLAGRHVHLGKMANLIVQVATERAPRLFSIAPTVPLAVCAVVDRALEFEPDRRYSNAREMQMDVRDVRSNRPPRFASNALPDAGPVPDLVPTSRRTNEPPAPSKSPESLAAERARDEAKRAAEQADFHAPRPASRSEPPTVARPSVEVVGPASFKATMVQVAGAPAPASPRTTANFASTMYAFGDAPQGSQPQQPPPQQQQQQQQQQQPQQGYAQPWGANAYPQSMQPAPSPMSPEAPRSEVQIAGLHAPTAGLETGGYAVAPRRASVLSQSIVEPLKVPSFHGVAPAKKKSSKLVWVFVVFVVLALLGGGGYFAARYFGVALPF